MRYRIIGCIVIFAILVGLYIVSNGGGESEGAINNEVPAGLSNP